MWLYLLCSSIGDSENCQRWGGSSCRELGHNSRHVDGLISFHHSSMRKPMIAMLEKAISAVVMFRAKVRSGSELGES